MCEDNDPIPLDEYPHIDMDRLEELCNEKSYTMPSGMTREQRHKWAKENLKNDESK